MRNTIVEVNLRPYDDGSGFREEIKATWARDGGKNIVAHVEILQGEQRLVVGFADWPALRRAIDEAIEDAGFSLEGPKPLSSVKTSDR